MTANVPLFVPVTDRGVSCSVSWLQMYSISFLHCWAVQEGGCVGEIWFDTHYFVGGQVY